MTDLAAKMEEITAQAVLEAKKMVEEEQRARKTDQKTILANWKANQKKRRDEEHQARVKDGRELAEAFIQEVAGPYLRLVSNKENLKKLASIRITFAPGKTDSAPKPSVAISDGSKRISTVFFASLQQLRDKETRELEKLQRSTMFQGSSPIEMMQEIQRLQGLLQQRDNAANENQFIVDAAEKVMRAVAENEGMEEALESLELSFMPALQREKALRAKFKNADPS